MWYSEVHRIGFRKCTPTGYRLLGLGDWAFLAAFLTPLAMLLLETFELADVRWTFLLWAVPLVVVGVVCKATANTLADKRRFRYDYEPDVASWDDGTPRRYTHAEWEAEFKAGRQE